MVEHSFVYVGGVSSSAPTVASEMSLADVERVVGVWCDQADPVLHKAAGAVVAVERLARVIRRLTAKQAAFAERVDAARAHPKQAGSPDDWLARQNGTSVGDARKAIDTARRLKSCPATADAFANGDLSLGEADVISAAARFDPSAEHDLVARATESHDLADTRARAAKVRAAARHGEDPTDRRRRLRALRRWSEFTDDELTGVAARFLPEQWAAVSPVIDAYAKPVFDQARTDGTRDSFEAYRADAVLAALAAAGQLAGVDLPTRTRPDATTPTGATGTASPAMAAAGADGTNVTATAIGSGDTAETVPTGGSPTKPGAEAECDAGPDAATELADLLKVRPGRVKWNVSVLVDGIALKRGYATARETCEIVGVGPVDVEWVSRILPEALVDVLVHDLVDIRAHATLTRHRRKAVEKAIRARDRRCVVPGCRRKRRLQADHRHDFAKRGPTSGANLELLCEGHHAEKTYRGARIERTDTEWLWYPPPPAPGEPEPPPGSIPWRAPIGAHLTAFDLDDLTDLDPDSGTTGPEGTLPFG